MMTERELMNVHVLGMNLEKTENEDSNYTTCNLTEAVQMEFVVNRLDLYDGRRVMDIADNIECLTCAKISFAIERITNEIEGQKIYRKVEIDDVKFEDWPDRISVKDFVAKLKIWFINHKLIVREEGKVLQPNDRLPGLLSARIMITISRSKLKVHRVAAIMPLEPPVEDKTKNDEFVEAMLGHRFEENWINEINLDPEYTVVMDEEKWRNISESEKFKEMLSPGPYKMYQILERLSKVFETGIDEKKFVRNVSDWASLLLSDDEFGKFVTRELTYTSSLMPSMIKILLANRVSQADQEVNEETVVTIRSDDDKSATPSDDEKAVADDDTYSDGSEEEKDTPEAKRLDQKISPVRD